MHRARVLRGPGLYRALSRHATRCYRSGCRGSFATSGDATQLPQICRRSTVEVAEVVSRRKGMYQTDGSCASLLPRADKPVGEGRTAPSRFPKPSPGRPALRPLVAVYTNNSRTSPPAPAWDHTLADVPGPIGAGLCALRPTPGKVEFCELRLTRNLGSCARNCNPSH